MQSSASDALTDTPDMTPSWQVTSLASQVQVSDAQPYRPASSSMQQLLGRVAIPTTSSSFRNAAVSNSAFATESSSEREYNSNTYSVDLQFERTAPKPELSCDLSTGFLLGTEPYGGLRFDSGSGSSTQPLQALLTELQQPESSACSSLTHVASHGHLIKAAQPLPLVSTCATARDSDLGLQLKQGAEPEPSSLCVGGTSLWTRSQGEKAMVSMPRQAPASSMIGSSSSSKSAGVTRSSRLKALARRIPTRGPTPIQCQGSGRPQALFSCQASHSRRTADCGQASHSRRTADCDQASHNCRTADSGCTSDRGSSRFRSAHEPDAMQQASDRSNHGINSRQCADSAQQASQPHTDSCADAAQQASQPHPYSSMRRHGQNSAATELRAQPVASAPECWQASQGLLPSQCSAVHSSQRHAEQSTTVSTSLLPSQCNVMHSSQRHAEQSTTANTSNWHGVKLGSEGQQDCSVNSQNESSWLQTGQIPARSGTATPTIVEARAVRRSLWAESGNMAF